MLAVRAVSDYRALADDQIDVDEGQLFYVLSATADGRKYFLSSSSRVPFSRFARVGFAPVPLFAVIGNTLPPAERAKVRMMICDSRAPQQAKPKADAASAAEIQVAAPEPRVGIARNISAAARYWLGGMTGRPTQDANAVTSASGENEVRRSSTGDDSSHAPLGSGSNRGSYSEQHRNTGSALNAPMTSSDRRFSVEPAFMPSRTGSVDASFMLSRKLSVYSGFAPSRKGSFDPHPLRLLAEDCRLPEVNARSRSSLSRQASNPSDLPGKRTNDNDATVHIPSKTNVAEKDPSMSVQGGDFADDDARPADACPDRACSGIAEKLTRGLERIGGISSSGRRDGSATRQKASHRFVQNI